jgi:hypothetical protein
MPPTSVASPALQTDALPPELKELVQELAVAVHKRGIYPASHPMQLGAVEAVLARLQVVLTARAELAIGIARSQLLIDGAGTDPDHPLVRELAERMHDHQLGGVHIRTGTSRAELDAFVAALSESPQRGGAPIGGRVQELAPLWPNLHVAPMAFDHLALLEQDGAGEGESPVLSRSAEVWAALARTALAGEEVHGDAQVPARLARSLEQRLADPEGRDDVISALLLAVDEIGMPGAPADGVLRQQVTQLVEQLSERAINQLLDMGGDRERRDAFLAKASDALGAQAVVELVRVAAVQDGAPISSAVLRLLQKMARGVTGSRGGARATEIALRRVARRMLRDWTLDDPNPEQYSLVLGELASAGSAAARDRGRDACEPERIVEISLDAGVVTPSTEAALGRLVMRDGVSATLERLEELPESEERESLVGRLINESMLREQLSAVRPDLHVLGHAVERLRTRAITPLLQALARRDETDATWVVSLLVRLGFDVLVPLGAAAPSLPPRALRHVLVVFDRLDAWPPGLDPTVFARHADASVRREAIRFLLKHEATRDQGTLLGLRDADMRTFNQAMTLVMRNCSLEAARVLMRRFDDPALGMELRARVARAIASVRSGEVLEWLCAQVLTTRWFGGAMRLRKPTMEVLAIIGAIAQHHRGEPAAARVLQLAERSRDDGMRRAASARPDTTGIG